MASLFHSPRLSFREARPGDLDAIYAMYNDPEVMLGAGGPLAPRHSSYKDALDMYIKTNPLYAVVAETATGAFVGVTYLRPGEWTTEYVIGVVVAHACRGRGFGREIVAWTVQHAFRMMGIHRVSLGVFASNARGIAAYKAVGFVQEGVKRKARFVYGKWEDIVLMSILDEEFFACEAGAVDSDK